MDVLFLRRSYRYANNFQRNSILFLTTSDVNDIICTVGYARVLELADRHV